MLGFFMGVEELNSDPQACTANILPTEPPLWLRNRDFGPTAPTSYRIRMASSLGSRIALKAFSKELRAGEKVKTKEILVLGVNT